eukprot:CAMPEP_0185694688 /NCGR_PEP_ID=MMETSP1164-20130828/4052_1 /TAXON_ID=1104430 /ORGANISM="Chrysoreinhardia sp, Strain CCMP2950" /LENGTH=111 /DNA_ID=CAMNT_0028361535 /DNA_START=116 /DNA_END=451 /DNA_ORIENTATION=+
MASRPATIEDFTDKVKELYASDPQKVRFVLKYKHADGSLTLRATNDELWLVYKTDQASELRRLEALHVWTAAAMCGATLEELAEAPPPAAEAEADAGGQQRRRGKKARRKQ